MIRRCASLLQSVKNFPTPLSGLLRDSIDQQGGCISFREFMDEAMRNKDHGYFTTKDGIIGGSKGADFVTAPELLPEFGWCMARWLQQAVSMTIGDDGDIILMELGPGTGRLMSQMLMFFKYELGEEYLKRIHLKMVEVSPVMISLQKNNISSIGVNLGSIEWCSDISHALEQQNAPTFVVSNEYFDVLPVSVVINKEGVWKEKSVGYNKDTPDIFEWCIGKDADQNLMKYVPTHRMDTSENDSQFEVCPQAVDDCLKIADRIQESNGMMLAIDYGKDIPSQNTLQGMSGQITCSPLLSPGCIDISWHVDFDCLRHFIRRAHPSLTLSSAIPQSEFLTKMGFNDMYQNRLASGSLPDNIERRHDLLMDSNEMGGHHRAVVLCSKELYPPPGVG
eukprot:TRINITY_DN2329_c6_g1_i1.p1 TRINITY_DN2329_c6_g1~~TRINITY_DN2329_c6_g1_i1.p1  ORF type:complete len:417 (+),score=63.78 TRINITY_DN2329_c6_g1_i1:74-1252(+)